MPVYPCCGFGHTHYQACCRGIPTEVYRILLEQGPGGLVLDLLPIGVRARGL